MVDRSELYPGAVVTVRAKVTHVGDNGVTVEALAPNEADVNHMRDIGVYFIDILSVEPRPLAVGEPVRHRMRLIDGYLRGICGEFGWAQWDSAPPDFSTELLSDLTRIPEDADEPAPAEKAMRFKVGDRVRCTFGDDAGLTGEIAHIRNELAWVDFGDNGDDLKLLEDLERAP